MFPAIPPRSAAIRGGQPQTVMLWEAMPGRHRGENVRVSASMMHELHTAQSVIEAVKEQLYCGSGNQKSDYMLTQGESYQRAVAARHVRDVDYRGDNQAIAKSALAAHGGTCGEHSALAMAYLSGMSLERPIFTCAVANHPDHQLNVIGDLREPRQAVVVDSWPVFAHAHLADNAALRPDFRHPLDVHLPHMPEKMTLDDMLDVAPLSQARIRHINQQRRTPDFNQVLANPARVRLEGRTHGVDNLGVRYQNRDNAADVLENVTGRTSYERQAWGTQQARRYFPDNGSQS